MEQIGRFKYQFLKSLNGNISEEDKKLIEQYEQRNFLSQEQRAKTDEYFKMIHQPQKEIYFDYSAGKLWNLFKINYKELTGNDFVQNDQTLENIKPLIMYFSQNPKFFNCENLITKFDFGGEAKVSEPNFKKGLLIIGGYGNGKTTVMKTFQSIFTYGAAKNPNFFSIHSANELVKLYEGCETPDDKEAFYKRFTTRVKYFDDVKTEQMASNYGKKNILKDILEERYLKNAKTYITCNYSESLPNSIEAGLIEFGEQYGSRIFDRLFEMFNIIEFKGKSFRK